MRKMFLRVALGAAMLGGASLSAHAQTATSTPDSGQTLRQRLDADRSDQRRTAGERNIERYNSDLEARRRILLRQRNNAVGSLRSTPIMPKTNRSSVVVTQ
ncbi:hypothetical protein [Aureimonas sp. ME7]|uniref:hypothetical protein n=1 Tax=Aureimonas sp. ME7 TaxID=2744252 RepID=UPI0015F367FB|nr:hypothetical protein [Aureimonas sp. ME7]